MRRTQTHFATHTLDDHALHFTLIPTLVLSRLSHYCIYVSCATHLIVNNMAASGSGSGGGSSGGSEGALQRALASIVESCVVSAQCTVCFEPFSGTRHALVNHPCGHAFCPTCLEPLLLHYRDRGCPTCRGLLPATGASPFRRPLPACVVGFFAASCPAEICRPNLPFSPSPRPLQLANLCAFAIWSTLETKCELLWTP